MTRRLTLTLKLTPGKDDDLIAWWLNLPLGSRQGQVKRLLRASALDIPIPQVDESKYVLPIPVSSCQPPEPDEMTEVEAERRARHIARVKW
jgi:hypothetical protein